jgi:hypothetical protein
MPDDKPTPEIWNFSNMLKLSGNFDIKWIKKTLIPSDKLINKINKLTN